MLKPTRTLAVVLVTMVLFGAAWSASVQAQSPVSLTSLEVKLWPEYDKPGVLVIYTGRFAPDVKLPVRLTFAIPAAIDSLGGTAGIDAQGVFRYRAPTTVQSGDQLLVSYDCPYPAFQFEYYYNPIAGQGADRQFEYVYVADYPVQNLTLRVQQPAGSSNFSVTPAMEAGSAEMGLPAFTRQVGALPAGGAASVAVSYRKDDLRLSIDQLGLPTPGTSPFEDAHKSAAGASTTTIVIAVIAGIVILTVVGLTLWSGSHKRPDERRATASETRLRPKKKGKTRSASSPMPASQAAGDSPVTGYCHRCGRGLKSDERFCPACGTPRK